MVISTVHTYFLNLTAARASSLPVVILQGPQSEEGRPMVELEKPGFDTTAFLAHAGLGQRIIQLAPKEAFFSQGDPADSIFYLQKSRAKVTVVSAAGNEATIVLVSSGEFVGEGALAELRFKYARDVPAGGFGSALPCVRSGRENSLSLFSPNRRTRQGGSLHLLARHRLQSKVVWAPGVVCPVLLNFQQLRSTAVGSTRCAILGGSLARVPYAEGRTWSLFAPS